VRDRGAGNLTYEELVHESSLTRGGITYHFPTKDDLLRALVRCDIEQWCVIEERLRPSLENEEAADLIAHIRSHTERNDDRRRFVAGMLSAVTLDRSLLDPVRTFMHERSGEVEWTDRQLMLQLLRLAAEGLYWSELFACEELPTDARKRLVTMMEQLAEEWVGTDAGT